MKIQKLYAKTKSYAVISVLALGVSSAHINAMGHQHKFDNPSTGQPNTLTQGNRHIEMKKRLHRLAKKLDLTQTQRSEVKEIFAEMKVVRQVHKLVMSGFKKQVQSLMQMPEFNERQFDIIYMENITNFQKMALEKAKVHHKVMQVLTAEQQQKFLTMQNK